MSGYTPLPGPKPTPILGWRGNVLRFASDTVGFLVRLHREFGDVVSFVETTDTSKLPLFVFAFGPRANQLLLSDSNLFHDAVRQLSPVLAKDPVFHQLLGLTAMSGPKHRQQRRLMQPAFHKHAVSTYHATIVGLTQALLDAWHTKQAGQPFDVAKEMQALTLRVALKTLFGIDANSRMYAIGHLLKQAQDMVLSPGVSLLPYNLPLSPYARARAVTQQVMAELRLLIAQKRTDLDNEHDALAMLMRAQDEDGTVMSETELLAQAAVLFLAGYETTANALTWTLFLLAQHPAVLHDLIDELHAELHGDAPSVEQIERLPLLNRVVKESLRLMPPLTFNVRASTADFDLGQFHLPKGAVVFYSEYVTHHLAELYAEPERFDPQRWEQITPSAYEYLPFGAGQRMCIGATFALFEIKIVLAMLLQRYQLAVVPNARIDRKVRVVLEPKHGMPMLVVPPEQHFPQNAVRGNIHEMVRLNG